MKYQFSQRLHGLGLAPETNWIITVMIHSNIKNKNLKNSKFCNRRKFKQARHSKALWTSLWVLNVVFGWEDFNMRVYNLMMYFNSQSQLFWMTIKFNFYLYQLFIYHLIKPRPLFINIHLTVTLIVLILSPSIVKDPRSQQLKTLVCKTMLTYL